MRRHTRFRVELGGFVWMPLLILGSALWVQSHLGATLLGHWSRDITDGTVHERCWGVYSWNGEIGLAKSEGEATLASWTANGSSPPPPTGQRSGLIPLSAMEVPVGPVRDGDNLLHEMGVGVGSEAYESDASDGSVQGWRTSFAMMPYWLVVSFAAIPPTRRAWQCMRRWLGERKSRRIGLCRHCGYDLRATPDRCPECGATPAAK
jgi:hypothetical protein